MRLRLLDGLFDAVGKAFRLFHSLRERPFGGQTPVVADSAQAALRIERREAAGSRLCPLGNMHWSVDYVGNMKTL